MRQLTEAEVDEVSGGLDWGSGGVAVLGLGFTAATFGVSVPLFAAAVGGSMLYLHYVHMSHH